MIFHPARLATEKAVFRPALPSCYLPGITEMQMNKMTYAEQLKHPNWQRKRLEALNLADFQCSDCGDKETTLHVHHKQYVKGRKAWEYEQGELQVLCENCHQHRHVAEENLQVLLKQDFREMSVTNFAYGFLSGFLSPFNEAAKGFADSAYQVEPNAFELGLAMAALGPTDLAKAIKQKIDEGRLPGAEGLFDSFLEDWLEK